MVYFESTKMYKALYMGNNGINTVVFIGIGFNGNCSYSGITGGDASVPRSPWEWRTYG
jgi:hypothetical protein